MNCTLKNCKFEKLGSEDGDSITETGNPVKYL